MTRFARLMAVTVAALFTGALAAPAYATGGGCDSHSATRTYSTSDCKAEGTKFNDLDQDGKRDSGEPGLAGFRIWADYDNDGVLDSGERYDDTDANGRYVITGINPPSSYAASRTYGTKTYRLREKLASGSGTGDWTCSYPNASTSGGFGAGSGSGFRCGHGPIDARSTPKATGKDFGNHRKLKPRITVIKALVPSTDPGRFDLKVDGATVKAAAGDGGTGSTLVNPGHHQVTETAVSGTTLADYTASISCLKNGTSAAAARTSGPGWVDVGYGDEVVCTVRNVRLGTVEVEKQTAPDETNGATFGFTSFAGTFSLADDGVKTFTRVTPRDQPYAVSENTATGYRLSSISCTDGDSTTSVATRTASIKVAAGEKVRCTFVNTKLVPGLQVVKDGPAAVHHGDTMTFTFAVSNTGNSPLRDVHVTDDHCADVSSAPVERRNDDGDALLEAGEVWVFSCRMPAPAHTTGEDVQVCNVATATGEDEEGADVTASDSHCTDIVDPPTSPPPPRTPTPTPTLTPTPLAVQPTGGGQVLGATKRSVSGRARLRGASGCVNRAFRAVVSGRQIRRVTFLVDGRRVARRTARGNQRRFTARIRPAGLGLGVHRVTARVVFRSASGTRPRTLLLSFQRCGSNGISPRFTG